MTETNYQDDQVLTAEQLKESFAATLSADGSQVMTGALAAPGEVLTDEATVTFSATAWNGSGSAPKEAFGLQKVTMSLAGMAGGGDTLCRWSGVNVSYSTSGTITAVGGGNNCSLQIGSYVGGGPNGGTPPGQYAGGTLSVVMGPGALIYAYCESQGIYNYPNDGIGSFGSENVGAQAWCGYMPMTQLVNQPSNKYHGAGVMEERDFWTGGPDTEGSRWLHAQTNGHLGFGLGYNIFALAAAQSAPGNTLAMPTGNTYKVGQAVTAGSDLPSGTVITGVSGSTITLSGATTAALAAGTAITIGNSYPATFSYGHYWELDAGVGLAAYLTTNSFLQAVVDTRFGSVNACNIIANAAAGATSLRVSNVQLFTYAGYYNDAKSGSPDPDAVGRAYCQPRAAGTFGPSDPGNFLSCVITDQFGGKQTVQVDGWQFDGPGQSAGTISLASGLATGFTDAAYAFTLAAATAAGATQVTFTASAGAVTYGMSAYAGGVQNGAYVTAVSGDTVTLSAPLCGAMVAGATITFATGAVTIETNSHPLWMADGQTIALDEAGEYTIGKDTTRNLIALSQSVSAAGGIAANGKTPPSTAAVITGSRGSATATVLESLLQALQAVGFVVDNTTA